MAKLIDFGGEHGVISYPDDATDEQIVEDYFKLNPSSIGDYAKQIGGNLIRGIGETVAAIPEGAALLREFPQKFFPEPVRRAYELMVPGSLDTVSELTGGAVPTASELLRGAGAAIRAGTEAVAPEEVPQLSESFWASKVPRGVGSSLAFLGGGVAGAAARIPAWLTIGGLGSLVSGADFYNEAKQYGADERTAHLASIVGNVVGTTEAMPLAGMIRRLDRLTGNTFSRAMIDAGRETIEEALQEGVQQLAQNYTAKKLYDEDRDLYEQVASGAGAGGVSGFLMSTLASALGIPISRNRMRRGVERRQAGIRQAVEEGQVFEQPIGETYAQRTGTEAQAPSQEAPLREGEDRGLRVRDVTQDRVEAVPGAPTPPLVTGLTKANTDFIIADAIRNWTNAPPIRVVQSFNELPQAIKDDHLLSGRRPDQLPAITDDVGTIWLVSDNITSPDDLKTLLAHEALGHRGVEAVFGNLEQFNKFMQGVDQLHAETPLGNSVRALYGTDPVIVGREIVARLAENPQEDPGLWETIVATVRGWVRKVFNIDVSDNDVRVLLARGRRKITEAPATTAQPLVTEPRAALQPTRRYTKEEFINIGDIQRGEAEYSMSDVHRAAPGVTGPVAEHVGDLLHRMNDRNTFNYAGYEYVKNKVEKTLSWLTRPYGFLREHLENLEAAARYRKVPLSEVEQQMDAALANYANEYRAIPVFNEAQRLAQEAAVSFGEKRWADTIAALSELNKHLGSEEEWVRFAREGYAPEGEQAVTEPTLKDAPVTYAGFQPGFGKIPAFHLYNLTETIAPNLVNGSTVTEKSLNDAGYKVPDSVKATQPSQGFRQSLRSPTFFETRQEVEAALSDPLLKPASIQFGRQMAGVQASMTSDKMAGFLMATPRDEADRIAQRKLAYLLDRRYLADTVQWFNSLPATTDEEKQIREVAASVVLGHYGIDRTVERDLLAELEQFQNAMEESVKKLGKMKAAQLKSEALTAAFNHLATEFKRYMSNRNAASPAGENLQAQWRQRMDVALNRLGIWERSPGGVKKALSALSVTLPDNLLQEGTTNRQIVDWAVQNGALFGEVSDDMQDWLLRDDGTGTPALVGYASLVNDLRGLRDVLNHQQAVRRELEAFEKWFRPSGTAKAISVRDFANRYFKFRSQRDRAMRVARILEKEIEHTDNNASGYIIALERLQEMMRSPEYVNTVNQAVEAAHVVVRSLYEVGERNRGLMERGGKEGVPPGQHRMIGPETRTEYVVDLSPVTAKERANQGALKAFAQEARSYAEKHQTDDPVVAASYKELADHIDRYMVNPTFDPTYGFTERPWLQIPGTSIRISMDVLGWSPKTVKDTLEKIGGRPVQQAVKDAWDLDKVMKKVEAINQHKKYGYAPQAKAVLKALASHNWTPDRFGNWDEMIAEPVIASSQNRLSPAYEVGDIIVGSGGVRITTEDMAAIRLMKEYADAVLGAAPQHIRDRYGDLGVTRKAIGGARFTMARIIAPWVQQFRNEWGEATTPEAKLAIMKNVESQAFRRLVMGYIGEFNPELNRMNAASKEASPFYRIYRQMAEQEKLGVRQFHNWDEVIDFMADEMVQRDLAPDVVTAREKAETGLRNEIIGMVDSFFKNVMDRKPDTIFGSVPENVVNYASANNSFTMPRGSLVAPSTFYSYSLGSYPRRAIHAGQLRSFLNLKLLQSLYEAEKGLASAKGAMDARIESLTRAGMKHARAFGTVLKESRAARRASEARYDYLEVDSALRMLEKVRKELERVELSTTEHYGHPGTEAWMNVFGSLKAFLLSSVQAVTTNYWSGVMLGPAMAHLQTGRLAKAFTDFALEPHFFAVLYRRLAAMVAGNPTMSRLLQQNVPLWKNLSASVLNAAADWKRVQDIAESSGMVSPYNLNDVLDSKAALKRTGGRLEDESPSAMVRAVNMVMSAPLVRLGIELPKATTPRLFDNFINYSLIIAFEYETEFLKKMGFAAFKAREQRAAQTGTDYRDLSKPENILTPGDLRLRSFKALERYRQLFAGLGSLDQVLLDFYERTKNLSESERRDAPLIPDNDEYAAAALQYAAITNVPTETNRPYLFKGKGSEGLLRNIGGTFMGWTSNILRQLSKTMETHSRDPDFNSYAMNMIGLASLVVLMSLTGMWNWELGDELTKLVYTQHSARIQPKNVAKGIEEGEWTTAMKYFVQSLVNTVPVVGPIIGGAAGLPFTGRGNPFDVTSWNPILGWIYDTWNTGKRIAQTGDATLPLADYTRRWVPFSKIVINRLPMMQGLIDQQNAVRSLAGSAPPGTEIKWGTRQGGGVTYSPANDEVQRLIAAAYEAVAHGGSMETVQQRYQEAIDAYIRAGRSPTDAPKALASALSSKEPIRILTGREFTAEEEQRWVNRMTDQQKADYGLATQAWGLLSNVTGRDLNMVSLPPGGGGGGLGIAGLPAPLRISGGLGPPPAVGAGLPSIRPRRLPGIRIRPARTRRRRLRGLAVRRTRRAGPRLLRTTRRRGRTTIAGRVRRRYTSLTT